MMRFEDRQVVVQYGQMIVGVAEKLTGKFDFKI